MFPVNRAFGLGDLLNNMDKLSLAQLGEKLKTGGAQMGRMVSGKMKEILQTPTPESKMVDEATLEILEEPNWGMNLRICAMINNEELDGSEIVKAIKKKISSKSAVSQRLSLDLLEACTMNCEKVFSEVASEKVLEDMIRMIDNPQTHHENRKRAMQLIRGWGESKDLAYLPVFHLTHMSLKERDGLQGIEGNSPYSLGSLDSRHSVHDYAFSSNHRDLLVEEKKEHLVNARNSLELLSSILYSEAEPKLLKEDLTMSLLEKCKQSLSVIKGIVEKTTNDEGTLFEALYLNDGLQEVVSQYEELEAAQKFGPEQLVNVDPTKHDADAAQKSIELPVSFEGDESEESEAAEKLQRKLPKMSDTPEIKSAAGVDFLSEIKMVGYANGEQADAELGCNFQK